MNLIFATFVMMALIGMVLLMLKMIGERLPDLVRAAQGRPVGNAGQMGFRPTRSNQAGGWSPSARRTARA